MACPHLVGTATPLPGSIPPLDCKHNAWRRVLSYAGSEVSRLEADIAGALEALKQLEADAMEVRPGPKAPVTLPKLAASASRWPRALRSQLAVRPGPAV
jgi:hypothetical protein